MSYISHRILNAYFLFIMMLISHNASSVVPEVKPFVDRFVSIAKQCEIKVNDETLRVEYNESKEVSAILATCQRAINLVKVNKPVFDSVHNIVREQLIFHELGHCLLHQDHDDNDLNLMNSEGFIEDTAYYNNYNYYIKRLFVGCKADVTFKYEDYK